MLDTMPEDWFALTLPYMPYFDNKSQRDEEGNVVVTPGLVTPTAANIHAWKTLIKKILLVDFKEMSKYHFGIEVGRMAATDGATCAGFEEGRPAETPDLAIKALFTIIISQLMADNDMGKVVALLWKWFYVPSPESNKR